MEEIEKALAEVGESLSPEDPVPQDAAELAAMELGRMVVFSTAGRGFPYALCPVPNALCPVHRQTSSGDTLADESPLAQHPLDTRVGLRTNWKPLVAEIWSSR